MGASLRERALQLLARREHARTELARKLKPHAESVEQLTALLNDLVARKLLSDERYAEARVNARSARFGDARLAHELRTQGVADELVSTVLAGGEKELSRAQQVWQRKFGKLPDNAVERARQMRFLMSRGFSGESIRHVLRGGRGEHGKYDDDDFEND